jgi:hypothetical protein
MELLSRYRVSVPTASGRVLIERPGKDVAEVAPA